MQYQVGSKIYELWMESTSKKQERDTGKTDYRQVKIAQNKKKQKQSNNEKGML